MADNLQFAWCPRPEQRLPEGDEWLYWLILTGRGWGKTRTLSETVRHWIKLGFNYVNLIGATADDVRTVSVEGPAGILACCPPDERPVFLRNSRELRWPNGATSLLFSAEEPDRLRGKQHEKLACDEIASWRDPEAWNQALFGLRLGRQPQAVIATTPRPTKIIKSLVADPKTHLTRGSTYDNISNLAPAYVQQIIGQFENTRLGRQELYAEILSDTPGALWTRAIIDRARKPVTVPDMQRVVVAVDPSGARSADDDGADNIGIVIAGKGVDGRAYVLGDWTCRLSPAGWGERAVEAYRRFGADRIVAERNFGGAMVEHVIRTAGPDVPFREVSASRGKVARAEPVAALYEQGRVSHAGELDALEDELCQMTTNGFAGSGSPDRADALVWGLTELMIAKAVSYNGFIEYYEELLYGAKPSPMRAADEVDSANLVRLRAPQNVNRIHTFSGRELIVPNDGIVEVSEEDARPLIAAGFERLTPEVAAMVTANPTSRSPFHDDRRSPAIPRNR